LTTPERIIAAAAVCALHLALLAPQVGSGGGSILTDFGPEGTAIEAGALPYRDEELEYPPLSIPVIVSPAWLGQDLQDYAVAFQVEMLLFDLGIVLLLALALRGGRREVLGALAVYTLGVVAISGIVLDGSDIDEAPLALDRFDLVPAFLVLAAVLARERGRSATWSALLSAGAMVKAYPLALFPALLRGERRPGAVAVAALVPVLVAAALVSGLGDEFAGAIGYHTGRPLQVESVAATPLEILAIDDVAGGAEFGSGSFNYVGDGAAAARAITLVLLVGAYALMLWAGWRSGASHLKLATALLAVIVAFSPVLSPQFMFWLLPVSAAAWGLRIQNVVLVVAFVLTQLMLQHYSRVVVDFDAEYVWRLAGRNAVLLLYVALVCWPILRTALRGVASGECEASST